MKTLFKTILFIIFTILISPSKVFADNKIRIGLVVPLSGEYAFVGESIIKSVRLALNQINDERIEDSNLNNKEKKNRKFKKKRHAWRD